MKRSRSSDSLRFLPYERQIDEEITVTVQVVDLYQAPQPNNTSMTVQENNLDTVVVGGEIVFHSSDTFSVTSHSIPSQLYSYKNIPKYANNLMAEHKNLEDELEGLEHRNRLRRSASCQL